MLSVVLAVIPLFIFTFANQALCLDATSSPANSPWATAPYGQNPSQSNTTGQTYQSGATGQTYQQGATGQTYQQGATGQTYQQGAAGQTYQQGATGQTYQPGTAGQTYQQGTTGQTYQPGMTGQYGQTGVTGQLGQQGIPGQSLPPGTAQSLQRVLSGQPVQPATAAPQPFSAPSGTPTAMQPSATPPVPQELSAVEQALSAESTGMEKARPQQFLTGMLTQFGYDFFKAGAPGFAPLVDIPVGPDYVIGPGDRIILSAWGSLEGTFELEVNRSGEIILPRVGSVKVWGVTYDRLPQVIRTSLSKIFKNLEINVTLGKLKLIKVYLVGEVKSPGDYSLSSLSTVINALSAAGGPLKTGSLRNIQVKRGGKVVETVDLYDFFLRGDKSLDVRLQSGDTILVPVIGPVAGITGTVKRPAIYELTQEKTLKELIALADGLLPTGYLQRVQISRVQAHEKNGVADYNLDIKGGKSLDEVAASIAIQDMDVVKIFPIDTILRGYARLEGYILRPGDYALKPGMRISDLLPADNLLPEYYGSVGEIIRLFPPDLHPEKIVFNPAQAIAGDPSQNQELKEFDTVHIFSRWDMEEMPKVRIGGEVQKPGEYRYYDNMTVRDLLTQAGNTKRTAYLKNAEISRIRKSGESVVTYPVIINLDEALKGNPKENIALAPFDELTVRKIPNWAEETDRYVTLSGEVVFPGIYPIYRGEKLSALLERAGGFTDKAYLKGAKFTRKLVQEEQQKRMDEVIAMTEQNIAIKQEQLAAVAASKEELEATRAALEGLMKNLEKLKTKKAEGRMVIRLASPEIFRNGPYDVELMGGDFLDVPKTPNSVHVMGQVYTPTTFIRMPGKDVSYYLELAGGPNREAQEDDMYIIRADGSVQSRQSQSGFFFDHFMSTKLDSGDTIVVPQNLDKIAWMREIKDIAMIVGQIALAAGVVVAAGL